MKSIDVYICDLDHDNIEPEKKVLEAAGLSYEWLHCKDEQEVAKKCIGAKALLNQYVKMNKTVFEAIPSLKSVVRYGVGYDNCNLEDATEYGVQISNVPDYGVNEVSDQAFALMLSLIRKTDKMNRLVRSGVWDYQKAIPIHRGSALTVGVVGVGRIGGAFVNRLRPFGYKIIGCDIEYRSPKRRFPEDIPFVSFEELLEKSDIISIHCSLNDSTHHLFGDKEFSKMKKGSYLINVARGSIVDEKALDNALTNGILAGAAIDVVEDEHLTAEHFLLKHENLLVTPHMAWYSQESALELKRKCAEEAVRCIKGEKVHYPVNKVCQED